MELKKFVRIMAIDGRDVLLNIDRIVSISETDSDKTTFFMEGTEQWTALNCFKNVLLALYRSEGE